MKALVLVAMTLLSIGLAEAQEALDHWHLRNATPLTRVRFTGGLFIGLGSNGKIMTSPDGANWTARSSGTAATLRGVAFRTGLTSPNIVPPFVIVGSSGVLTSTNGTDWALGANLGDLNDVVWNGSKFVTVATRSSVSGGNSFTSSDGTNWMTGTFPLTGGQAGPPDGSQGAYYTGPVAAGGGWLITAGGTQFGWDILRSFDGLNWQYVGFSDQVATGIVYGNKTFTLVGWEGWPRVTTNSLATNWVSVVDTNNVVVLPPGGLPIMVGSDICFGNGTFLVARSYLTNGILTTTNGFAWKKRPALAGVSMESFAFGKGTFVGVGRSGTYQSDPVAPAVMVASRNSASNAMDLLISGEVGRAYRLQTSATLSAWSDSLSFTNTLPTMEFLDPVDPNAAQLFYRVVSP
ncbi:MAG: hypothetical protein JWR69_738 [Pedosphaera sp.]|nr:hypothetical protein [Pedosphaera sp.]